MFIPQFFLASLSRIAVVGSAIARRNRRSDDFGRLNPAAAPSGVNSEAQALAAGAQIARSGPGAGPF